MAIIKTQNNKRNAANDGWDVIHHETSGSLVVQDTSNRLVTDTEKTTWNGKIDKSIFDAAGDLIYGTADNTPARLAKGTDGQVLTLASGLPSWANVAKSVYGSYTGNETAGSLTARLTNIGFTPKFIFITSSDGRIFCRNASTRKGFYITLSNSISQQADYYYVPLIVENGFQVGGNSGYTNTNNVIFDYVAIG